MVNTALQALGWVVGLLAWGGTVGMLMSEKWRGTTLRGDQGSVVDTQGRHEGLWTTCNKFPSGEVHCTLLPIEISDTSAVVVGCRSLLILAILFGIVGALVIMFAFKCTSHGPTDEEQLAILGRYGGATYLLCGICVTVASSWYILDVYSTIALPDPRGIPTKWRTGEGVQVALAAGILWILGAVAVMLGSRHYHHRRHHDVMTYEAKKPLHEEFI